MGKYTDTVNTENVYCERCCFKRKTCALGLGQVPGSGSWKAFLLSFWRFYAIWHDDFETIPENRHVHSAIIYQFACVSSKRRKRGLIMRP